MTDARSSTSNWAKAISELHVSVKVWLVFVSVLCLCTIVTWFVFTVQSNVPSSFLSDLVSFNALLMAAIAFLFPSTIDALRLKDFVNRVTEEIRRLDSNVSTKAYLSKFLARTLHYLIDIPLLVVLPFFLSSVIALLGVLGFSPTFLAAVSFWLMISSFLTILLGLWELSQHLQGRIAENPSS